MDIIELARNGDISVLWLWIIGSLVFFTPITLLVAKNKNRITTSIVILCFLPGVNIYVLFFLMLMQKRTKM